MLRSLSLTWLIFAVFSTKICFGSMNTQRLYIQAIEDYLRQVKIKYRSTPDTLFIIKRIHGKSDDFPNIDIPEKLLYTRIIVWSEERVRKAMEESSRRKCLNMMGWIEEKKSSEFIFVLFSNGYQHMYDCTLRYVYNRNKRKYLLKQTIFKDYTLHSYSK